MAFVAAGATVATAGSGATTLTVSPTMPTAGDTVGVVAVARVTGGNPSLSFTGDLNDFALLTAEVETFNLFPQTWPDVVGGARVTVRTLPRADWSSGDVSLSVPSGQDGWLSVTTFSINVDAAIGTVDGDNGPPSNQPFLASGPSVKYLVTFALDYDGNDPSTYPPALNTANGHTVNLSRDIALGTLYRLNITSRVDAAPPSLPLWGVSSGGPYMGVYLGFPESIPPAPEPDGAGWVRGMAWGARSGWH